MRELLYLSRPKLDTFMPNGKPVALRAAELGVDVSVVNARIEAGPSNDESTNEPVRFGKVIKHIARRAGEVHDRSVRPGEWIWFDMPMGYGKVHEDTALPDLPDDVVLFGGDAPQADSAKPVELLLCGSACRLTDRCAPATGGSDDSRMGSGTRWLHEMITLLNSRDEEGITTLPPEIVKPEHRIW
ncbi:SAVMC3_10250 family protein [Streptomyces sp. NPDC005898]|uniref:SAVMC3_10250 family protein n=1 Tax=Streptomyces sp. NPDC005898 TaxID=3157082 RepID=UPI0033F6899E